MKIGIAPRTVNMKLFNSEKRKYFDNGRGDSDIFWRGLLDGYRLEQERIHRMMKEKEEEKKIDMKVKNIMKEWEKDMRSKIEKELREEMTIEFNRRSEIIEEERTEDLHGGNEERKGNKIKNRK